MRLEDIVWTATVIAASVCLFKGLPWTALGIGCAAAGFLGVVDLISEWRARKP